MKWIPMLVIAALIFGFCFLVDKGFTKLFRGKKEHGSGLSVRLNKRYGSAGVIVFVLGVAALFVDSLLMLVCGIVLVLGGVALVIYYMTFGIFYDDDSFILTTFGKKSGTYQYRQIVGQQLYNSAGNIVIELYMDDGRAVQLHSAMTGAYPFLDSAFVAWLRQTGKNKEDCSFYDPDNSCWFPSIGE